MKNKINPKLKLHVKWEKKTQKKKTCEVGAIISLFMWLFLPLIFSIKNFALVIAGVVQIYTAMLHWK